MHPTNRAREQRATAYHEAGHALAYFMADVPIELVSIDPDLARAHAGVGVTKPAATHLYISLSDVWRLIAVPAAGAIGEAQAEGDDFYTAETNFLLLQAGDYALARANAEKRAAMVPGLQVEALITGVFEATWRVFQRAPVRRAVDSLAAALIERGTLNHTEAFTAANFKRARSRIDTEALMSRAA